MASAVHSFAFGVFNTSQSFVPDTHLLNFQLQLARLQKGVRCCALCVPAMSHAPEELVSVLSSPSPLSTPGAIPTQEGDVTAPTRHLLCPICLEGPLSPPGDVDVFSPCCVQSLTSAAYNSALTGTAGAPTAAKTWHICGATGLSPHGVNMRACACRRLLLMGPGLSMRPSAIIQCARRSRRSPVMYALAAAPAWPVRPWVLWSCLTEPCVGRQCLAVGAPASSLGHRLGFACVAKWSCLQQASPSH